MIFVYLRFMTKWIIWIGILSVCFGCQSEIPADNKKVSDKIKSGTVDHPKKDSVTVPLIFLLEELEIKGSNSLSIRDTALFRSLPAGVYEVKADTILFGNGPTEWVGSGITHWPARGRVALADFIISDNSLSNTQIGIFPQQPGEDGYLPGCFSCPEWMVERYGALLIFWEKYWKNLR